MLKTLMIGTAAVVLFASSASADTVRIVAQAQMTEPSGSIVAQQEYGFQGTTNIVVKVFGKTCTLNGSARGSVPMGCNYTIAMDPSGTISGELRAGNNVCTQTPQVASSCK